MQMKRRERKEIEREWVSEACRCQMCRCSCSRKNGFAGRCKDQHEGKVPKSRREGITTLRQR